MGTEQKITVRRSAERGRTELNWLKSWHTFSFGEFYDPSHMGFRALRVINDDRIAPGAGFGMHGHRDMEIITVVLSGALEHRDSLGNCETLRPGEVQVMTAGQGIRHSEVNPSSSEPCHLLQIWIEPTERSLAPHYEQKHLDLHKHTNGLVLAVGGSKDRSAPLSINQDARLFLGRLASGAETTLFFGSGRSVWIHVATGSVSLDGMTLTSGDSCSVEGGESVVLTGVDDSFFLIFDLA